MSVAGPALAGTAVVAAAATWSLTARWIGAQRAVARLDRIPSPNRAVPAPIGRALRNAGVETDHLLVLHAWGAAVVAGVVAAMLGTSGVLLLAAIVVGPPGAVLAARGRAARLRSRQIPLVLDAVATGLRGGVALRSALADAAAGVAEPLRSELESVVGRARAGMPLAAALTEWVDDHDDAPSRFAGASLVVAAELGGPGAAAIDAAAASLRDRAAADDEVTALSVQARLSAMLLTAAPIAFALLLTGLDPTSAHFLLGTPAGWMCIVTGLALDAAGAAWMARLVRKAR